MPKKRFTEEKIGFALRQAESGTSIGEICRRMGVAGRLFIAGRSSLLEWGLQRSDG
jgi:putative transposase